MASVDVQDKIDQLIGLQASQWLERLPDASDSEREDFVRWLQEGRANLQAFLEIAEIEYGLHQIDTERREDVVALVEGLCGKVISLRRAPAITAAPKRWRTGAAIAAGAAVVAVGTLVILKSWGQPQFSTSIGEQKTVELNDRSVVTLNAGSRIQVDLSETGRDVQLREGEAIFTVAHDPKRPFRVYTETAQIEAVGTQFNVYARSNGSTRVSVLEGRVRLLPRAGSESDDRRLLLQAGQEAEISADGTLHRNTHAVVADAVAWRQRRLVFNDAWLEDMVVEFNRYNRNLQVRLEDVPERSYRYDGVFDAADPQSFVSLLEREPGLRVEQKDDEVMIRPAAPTR